MTDRAQPPQRPTTRTAASARGAAPRSQTTPQRRSTRPVTGTQQTKPTTGWAKTGVAAPASSTAAGGRGGSGGGKGGGRPVRQPEGPRWKRVVKRIGIGALIAGFVAVAVGSITLMVVYSRLEVPEASDVALAQASTVYWADGETEMGRIGEVNREIVDCAAIPAHVPQAIVAAEDRSFYSNPGIDFVATARALFNTVVLNRTQGGSTITQQYVERYYVGETTTDIPGKIREALLALKVDSEQTKDEVLCNYMNTIYFGRGAYGIEAAAQAYFAKPATELSVSEAAMLAGIIPAPSAWDPRFDADRAEQRWNYVLDGMVEIEALTQDQRDSQTFPETVEFVAHDTFGGPTGYLLRTALNEAMRVLGIDQEQIELGGYRIVTTVQQEHQRAVEEAVAAMPDDHADNLYVAASTVDARTGAITSMYGGEDYLTRQRNAVTQDIAQAGSTFKPFAMIAALSDGYSLNTTYTANTNMTFDGFENPVRNFGGVNYGRIDMIEATQRSVNTYYVQLAGDVGNDRVMDTAIAAGLPEDTIGLDSNPANVLGTASPTQLSMVHAYTTIADTGLEKDPYMVQTVTDAGGTVVLEHSVDAQRVFDQDVIADATYAMQQVVNGGTARKAEALGRPLAGKTGTSNDNRSAWFIGFSPQIVGAVSMYQSAEDGSVEEITAFGGYDQITGGSVPADVWVAMMGPILDGYDVVDFPPRASVGQDRGVISTPTPSPTPTETAEPIVTPSPTETAEPVPSPTPTATETADPVPTPEPSSTPAPTVTTDPGGAGTGIGAGGGGGGGGDAAATDAAGAGGASTADA